MRRRWLRRAAAATGIACAAANAAAYAAAWALTRRPDALFRPETRRVTPAALGPSCERHVFTALDGTAREAWYLPHPQPRAVVALFHGYGGRKSDLLREARAFHRMGLAPFLVDLRGAGDSPGDASSIGFYEADDVAAAAAYARALPGRPPLVLYGNSMGAAAALKAVSDRDLGARALVAEMPFNRLLTTVERRFESRRLPSFPWAQLLVFWGGWQQGFDGFRHNPAEYARRVHTPTLIIAGDKDPWVRPEDVDETFAELSEPKALLICPGLGHQSCLRGAPTVWLAGVAAFLDRHLPAGPGVSSGPQRGGRASS
ncbi:MAG TPA: alpha/beta fold hydrolase [Vicinamibacteria bacterium]